MVDILRFMLYSSGFGVVFQQLMNTFSTKIEK